MFYNTTTDCAVEKVRFFAVLRAFLGAIEWKNRSTCNSCTSIASNRPGWFDGNLLPVEPTSGKWGGGRVMNGIVDKVMDKYVDKSVDNEISSVGGEKEGAAKRKTEALEGKILHLARRWKSRCERGTADCFMLEFVERRSGVNRWICAKMMTILHELQ